MKAPMYHDGKQLNYEETFRSPFARPTRDSAREVQDAIRAEHNSAYGWAELEAWIDETPQGFVAVRRHAQYK